jgi:hypothetical protein
MPELSLVLVLGDQARELPGCWEALARQQQAEPRAYEILLVGDRAHALAAAARLPAVPAPRGLELRSGGPAPAKNLGLFASRGRHVLFLEPRDVPDPHFVAAYLQALQHFGARGEVLWSRAAPGPVWRDGDAVHGAWWDYGRDGRARRLDSWGVRAAYPRALLLRHGVFNPQFDEGMEEVELAWRLMQLRIPVRACAGARLSCQDDADLRSWFERERRWGRGQWLFSRMHPTPGVLGVPRIDRALVAWGREDGWAGAQLEKAVEMQSRLAADPADGPGGATALREQLQALARGALEGSRALGITDGAQCHAEAPQEAAASLGERRYGYERVD